MNKPTTRYFYDGQMACEEDFAEIVPNEDPFFEVTRYGLGARGVDWIEKATIEDTSISFPIYDGHGNVIAQLGRTGSSYSLTQVKRYDVWGGVRSGALGPAGRYCGNLGHVSDDESGLIYMRARYYEPGSGRFISEDPAMDGLNWFAYCGNDPVGNVDPDGKESTTQAFLISLTFAFITIVTAWGTEGMFNGTLRSVDYKSAMVAFIAAFLASYVQSIFIDKTSSPLTKRAFFGRLGQAAFGGMVAGAGIGCIVAMMYGSYGGALMAELFYMEHGI